MSTICIDFDGVLAQYDGWKGEDVLGDPAPGAKEFVRRLLAEGHTVAIHTTRKPPHIWKWLETHDMVSWSSVYPTNEKPPALVYIDDRGFRFTGDWEAAYQAITQPAWWEKRGESGA